MSERDRTAVAADQALDAVRAGRDLALEDCLAGRALLDRIAAELEPACRVVRVDAGPTGLSLSGFMAQVAGDADLAGQDDSVLELGYRRLAVPDGPGQRIALLIDGAGRLQRPALRFVQHVARRAPALVLVITRGPEFDSALEDPDFAVLRSRFGAALAVAAAPKPAPARARLSTVSVRARRRPVWAAVGVGMAASVALAVGLAAQRAAAPVAGGTAQAVPAAPVPETARPLPAAAQAEPLPPAQPVRQEAMLVPQPALATPAAPAQAEPERAPGRAVASKPAETHRKEPARPAAHQAHAARPSPRLPEFDRAPPSWGDERPRPVFSGPMPRFWGRLRDMSPDDRPPEGSYIGTYATDGYGMRTFHYGR